MCSAGANSGNHFVGGTWKGFIVPYIKCGARLLLAREGSM